MPTEALKCNRWSYTELDQSASRFEVWYFVPAIGAQALVQINEFWFQ